MINAYRIPESLLYSQQSLSVFEQCPVKFRMRYLENLRWDSVFDPEKKKHLDRGRNFHLLAKRYFLGMDVDGEDAAAGDETLVLWLRNLKHDFPLDGNAQYFPEHTLVMRRGNLRLQAVIDLIVKKPAGLEIWDWKTHSPQVRPESANMRTKLENSLQTRVYMFLLQEYSAQWGAEGAGLVMSYWQPDLPGIAAEIAYSGILHEENRMTLSDRINSIETYDWNSFNKILFSKHCRYCEFNWYCNGPAAVSGVTPDDDGGIDF